MEIKVYREKVQDKGIFKSHKGEDAKAYVGARAIMVADGLGGAAAIRHQQFDRDLFDKDKIMDVLFEGIYDEYKSEDGKFAEFENYVLESFADFCAMGDTQEKQDKYFKDTLSMKKGGYFGSRIVTAIVLYEILHGTYFWEEGNTVWDKVHGAKDVDELKAVQDEIGDQVAKTIKEKLKEISEKVNLKYESAMTGLALLGTTVCATLYNENKEEGYVEALYLCAGDSRPYVIGDEVDGVVCGGIAQVVADQEGEDGGMSNCIKANADFMIACEYRRFKTPCILFNTSDGCFDSAAFPTQLALEKLLLDCIVGNPTMGIENMEEGYVGEEGRIAEQLRAFFVDNGRHDDSTTIAFKSVGFETDENGNDFEAVKEFAKKRLEEIEEKYLKGCNPEMLYKDYEAEAQVLKDQADYVFKQKKVSLWAKESVQEYCKALVGKDLDAQAEEELRSQLAKHEETLDGYKKECAKAIKPYYLSILKQEGTESKETEKAEKFLSKAKATMDEIHDKAKEYKGKLDGIKAALETALQGAKDTGFDKLMECQGKDVSANKEEVFALQEKMQDFLQGLKKKYKQIYADLEEYHKINEKAAGTSCQDLVNRLPALKEKLASAIYSEKDYTIICGWIDKMLEEIPEIERIQDVLANNLLIAAKAYWDNHFQTVMQSIAESNNPEVSLEEKAEVCGIFDLLKKREEALTLIETQKKLFDAFEEDYNRIMESELKICYIEKVVSEAPVETTEEVTEVPEETTEEVTEVPEETTEEVTEVPEETTEEVDETTNYDSEPDDLQESQTDDAATDSDMD